VHTACTEFRYSLLTETATLTFGIRWFNSAGEFDLGQPLGTEDGLIYSLIDDKWVPEDELDDMTTQDIRRSSTFALFQDKHYG
jgi:hypothetical protein